MNDENNYIWFDFINMYNQNSSLNLEKERSISKKLKLNKSILFSYLVKIINKIDNQNILYSSSPSFINCINIQINQEEFDLCNEHIPEHLYSINRNKEETIKILEKWFTQQINIHYKKSKPLTYCTIDIKEDNFDSKNESLSNEDEELKSYNKDKSPNNEVEEIKYWNEPVNKRINIEPIIGKKYLDQNILINNNSSFGNENLNSIFPLVSDAHVEFCINQEKEKKFSLWCRHLGTHETWITTHNNEEWKLLPRKAWRRIGYQEENINKILIWQIVMGRLIHDRNYNYVQIAPGSFIGKIGIR